jgi:hypothetical protein
MVANAFDNRGSFERPFRRPRTIQFARDKYLTCGLFVPESRRPLPGETTQENGITATRNLCKGNHDEFI